MVERAFVRPARVAECEWLGDLARRSKAVWGYDATFMAACHDELRVSPESVVAGDVFVAEVDGVVAGVHALEAGERAHELELGLLFVDPGWLRRGVGASLLAHAVASARERGALRLMILSDPHAAGFYLAQGARACGERPSDSIAGRLLPVFVIDLAAP